MKLIKFFLVKKLTMKKGKIFTNFFFKLLFRSRNRNRNHYLSKVGTGTVTCKKSEPEPEP
jgi:hypothetical protein